MRNLVRIGVVVLAATGLFGTSLQPAAAIELIGMVYTGTAEVGPNVAFPCLPDAVATPGSVAKCPVLGTGISANLVPTGHGPIPRPDVTFHGGNSTTAVFFTDACAITKGTALKEKDILSVGTCAKAAGGMVHGYCGLAEGILGGTLVTPATGPLQQTYSFIETFVTVAGVGIVQGSMVNHTSGQTGQINGLFLAVPTDTECTSKDESKEFRILGVSEAFLNA